MSLMGADRVERDEFGVTYVDKSGTITTGGTAQSLAAANAYRDHMFIGNPNAVGSLWVNDLGGTAAANGAGSTEAGFFSVRGWYAATGAPATPFSAAV